jgi:serine/threonine-protein kinase
VAELPCPFGDYELLRSLGSGGTGDVYLARPLEPGRGIPTPVVIKRLHGQLAAQDDFIKRFRHESAVAVAVDSPYVVKVFDVGRVQDTLYIAMEYLAGWTIARLATDLADAKHMATLSSIASIIQDALLGLEALHTARSGTTHEELGIIHRDIAPKNIMVCEDGKTRLIDLGLGKSRLQDWKTATGIVMGSPGYMAPEQIVSMAVDRRTDLYGMGIVLWELVTLRRYIQRGPIPLMLRAQVAPAFVPPSELRPDVPPALDEVLKRALALEPEARFQTAREFITALHAALPSHETRMDDLIGEMLWGELSKSKTEVTQLVDLPSREFSPRDKEVVVVYAERLGVQPVPTQPMPTPNSIPSRRSAPGRGVSPRVVVMLMLVMLVVGLGAGALLMHAPESALMTAPAGAQLPAAERPEPVATVREAQAPDPPAVQPTNAPRPPPAHIIAREARARLVRSTESQPTRPEPSSTPALRPYDSERMKALIARARRIKDAAAEAAAKERANRVLINLMKESTASDLERATSRIAALESELNGLEKELAHP